MTTLAPTAEGQYLACADDPVYFVGAACQILSIEDGDWIPFELWPAQLQALDTIHMNQLLVILKARQLGLTWLCRAYALWQMIHRPIAQVLLLSRRDTEAQDLLARMIQMAKRLPPWLRPDIVRDSGHDFVLANGSRAQAFPTTAGEGYTASLVVVDEADLVPDLGDMLRGVKPTIDAGGKLVLVGRVNKGTPNSPFQTTYRQAKEGGDWTPLFLPWHARPDRDQAWYERQKAEIYARTGALDDLYEQYPATDAEALSPRSLDKRIPPAWLLASFQQGMPKREHTGPSLPHLRVFEEPAEGGRYVVTLDPAEGNPGSDESAIEVVALEDGGEVANLAGRLEPSLAASYANTLARWYNQAPILVERNNHGHAAILWLRDHGSSRLLSGLDGKPGWLTNSHSKAVLWAKAADAFRDGEAIVRDMETFRQLSAIEGATLSAPPGDRDDRAIAYALAVAARSRAMFQMPEITSRIRRG